MKTKTSNNDNKKFSDKNINKTFLKGIAEDANSEFYDDKELDQMEEKEILQLPYTDDEKSSHLLSKTTSKFGIYSKNSDNRGPLPNQLFSADLEQVLKKNNSKTSSANSNSSVSRPSNVNINLNISKSKLNNNYDNKLKEDDEDEVDNSSKPVTNNNNNVGVKDKKSYFENKITKFSDNNEKSNLTKNKNLSKSCNFNDGIFNKNLNTTANISQLPKPEYVIIDDIELSDTSYDEDDDDDDEDDNDDKNESGNTMDKIFDKKDASTTDCVNNNNNNHVNQNEKTNESAVQDPLVPPPKPKRTFEHDIYTTFKLDLNKAFSTELTDFDALNLDHPSKVNSPVGNNDHIYESLSPFQNFTNNNSNYKNENKLARERDEAPSLIRTSNQSSNKPLSNKKVIIFYSSFRGSCFN